MLSLVTACEQNIPAKANDYCLFAEPITMSAKDTEVTKKQIDIHNAKWEVICGS